MEKLSPEEITRVVAKIRKRYEDYIYKFFKPKTVLFAFEERYLEALQRKTDVSTFLMAEISAVEELIKVGCDTFIRVGTAGAMQPDTLVGDLAIVTAPGELFSEYAARFRQLSPAPCTLVASLANDSVGYLVTDQTHAEGALEGMRAAGQSLEAPLLDCARRALAGVAG